MSLKQQAHIAYSKFENKVKPIKSQNF